MKVGGVEVKGPAEEILVLLRPTAEDIVFRAKAVMDTSNFDRLVPEPKAKSRLVAGGEWKEHLDDPEYLKAMVLYGELRFNFLVLASLEPSNIEWEIVEMDKPSTWSKWSDELSATGLSQTEINRVIACVSAANSLDETKLEAARQSFLRGLAKASEKSSGQSTEPPTTQSGDPVSG